MRRPDQEPLEKEGAMELLAPIIDLLGVVSKVLPKRKQKDPTDPDFAGALAYILKNTPQHIGHKEFLIARALNPQDPEIYNLKAKGSIHRKVRIVRGKKEILPKEYKLVLEHLLTHAVFGNLNVLKDMVPETETGLGKVNLPQALNAANTFTQSPLTKLDKFNLKTSLLIGNQSKIKVETTQEKLQTYQEQRGYQTSDEGVKTC